LKMEFSELNNYLSEIQPNEPAVLLGYWKVWLKNANFFPSCYVVLFILGLDSCIVT
jgi:hypothetical protein